jgi:hypothetical protein
MTFQYKVLGKQSADVTDANGSRCRSLHVALPEDDLSDAGAILSSLAGSGREPFTLAYPYVFRRVR